MVVTSVAFPFLLLLSGVVLSGYSVSISLLYAGSVGEAAAFLSHRFGDKEEGYTRRHIWGA